MALTSDNRRYSRSLVDDFFGGGGERENNFAENRSWTVKNSMGQSL
ncbi:MAG: hypothetical protein QNJ55_20760 [Xenococcus sp. MO_188.B8]|nr:hypothetical protein [Xenococcus sp. MO_188.B8]